MTPRVSHSYMSDEQQDSLRAALNLATKYMSKSDIRVSCEVASGKKFKGKKPQENFDKAIRSFVNGETKSLSKQYFEPISAVWLHSPVVRALLSLESGKTTHLDELSNALAAGSRNVSSDNPIINIDGLYFMYYGSYVEPNYYSIRVIEIKTDGNGLINVTDTINDWIQYGGNRLVSHGVLTFFRDSPQILLLPQKTNETKVGLTLMLSIQPLAIKNCTVEGISGVFLTRTESNAVATRCFLMLREPSGNRDRMISESGPYKIDDLKQRHRSAFDELKKNVPKIISDPMLIYNQT